MLFFCLVDADFRDTEAFYSALDGNVPDRDWPGLADVLDDLRAAFDRHMVGLGSDTDTNRIRKDILDHVRSGASLPSGLFTLTVPTGGGKTLASPGFALDHAAIHGHRRIFYAIPYTSIIDQTAGIFRSILGDLVLEHHSAVDIEEPGLEGKEKLRLAMEDWAAPIVVTTNVQLFESLFLLPARRAAGNLHHIAGSVIILDEAQTLPRQLLLPTLADDRWSRRALRTHDRPCTATQPAFDSSVSRHGPKSTGRELVPDPQALSARMRRARIVLGG